MDDFVGRKNLVSEERLRELTQRSDLRGALQATSHFGAIALTGYGLYALWGTWWAVPLFILQGMLLNYLFAAQHELNHYTAFKTRWVNDVANRITGFLLLYPRSYERWSHFVHHRNTQNWQTDSELLLQGRPYTLGKYLLYLVGITYWLGRIKIVTKHAFGQVPNPYFTDHQRRHIVWEARGHLLGYALVATTSVYLNTWLALQVWLAPMLTTKLLHIVQNITEHAGGSHEPDTVHNTRTIKTWPIVRWMAWNMQYHTAHHTYPAVPFYRLPALHSEMVKQLGYEPPTTSYLGFQWRFIRHLLSGPEPREGLPGLASIPPKGPLRQAANARETAA